MGDISITIVIPTRERCDVLPSAIQSALAVRYPHFTVLVSDNCSNDDTPGVVAGFSDPRLRYVRAPSRLSMSHHWEFALSHVRDGWVTVIGDDDALLPHACAVVNRIAWDAGVEAVRSHSAEYRWPRLEQQRYGTVLVPLKTGVTLRDASKALEAALDGITPYTALPLLYTGGFVSVAAINRARGPDGAFFRSLNPDVYSGVALCGVISRYAWHHGPLAVAGASRHSNGCSNFGQLAHLQKFSAGPRPAELFFAEPNIPFHADLPCDERGRPPALLQVCLYEAFLQAAHLFSDTASEGRRQQFVAAVLRTAGLRRAEARSWIQRFQERHALARPIGTPASVCRNLLIGIQQLRMRMKDLYVITVDGTEELPMATSMHAVGATETILQLKPSRLFAFVRRATSAVFRRLRWLVWGP